MPELKLREYQEDILAEIRGGFKRGHHAQMLYLPTGGGKCLGFNTPVLMYDGSIKKVQDIIVGDILMSPNSEPRNVLSTSKGREKLYKITPVKGDSYIVNASHILSLKKTGGSDVITLSDGTRILKETKIINVNVEVFNNSSKTAKHCIKGWRSEEIEFNNGIDNKELPSYILGAWLGDGSKGQPVITKPPCNMIEAWKEYGESVGYKARNESANDRCDSWRLGAGQTGGKPNIVKERLRSAGVLNLKHIPDSYKFSSIQSRLDLIAGLIDSDGHLTNNSYDWISVSERLANDFVFICRSVGLAAYVKECVKGIASTGFSGIYWRVSISGNTDKIPCLDKKASPRKQKKNVLVHGISIQDIGEGDYYGFEIDGDHLFLLGDFTVTHNTECAISMLKAAMENGSRSAMVMDRRVLCDQTSERLDKYEIDHGVLMAGHWRYQTYKSIQVCSAQTLEKRGSLPNTKLLIIDEAHNIRKQTKEFIKNNKNVFVIGLSASPVTKGLANIFSRVVNGLTTKQLVENGNLSPLRVFIAKEIDMKGAKKVAGEWSAKETSERGIKITGDIVSEWVKKTYEIFNEPKKTIVFCAGVAHGLDLSEKFKEAGYNFVSLSYKDDDEFKRETLIEFAKKDSKIHGVIATDILTKGFDQADIFFGISARPFTKSFSSHIQQLGRIMRPHKEKEAAIWLDHSGNYLRFKDDWDDLYENGITTLIGAEEKPKKEVEKEEKEAAICPNCGELWGAEDACQNCGKIRERRNEVIAVAGELQEIKIGNSKIVAAENAEDLYNQLCSYAKEHSAPQKQKGRAAHLYKDIMGDWPKFDFDKSKDVPISAAVKRKIRSKNIAFAKRS